MQAPTFTRGDSRLHGLVSYSYVSDEAVKAAVRAGAPVDAVNALGQTPLFNAVRCSYFSGLTDLLSAGANPNAVDYQGRAPVHMAALLPSYAAEVVQLLWDAGSEVTAADADGLTPVHLAAACGNAECLQKLVYYGASVNVRTLDGETPLHMAVNCGSADCVRLLLLCGAHTDVPSAEGLTPSQLAERQGMRQVAKIISRFQTAGAAEHLDTAAAALAARGIIQPPGRAAATASGSPGLSPYGSPVASPNTYAASPANTGNYASPSARPPFPAGPPPASVAAFPRLGASVLRAPATSPFLREDSAGSHGAASNGGSAMHTPTSTYSAASPTISRRGAGVPQHTQSSDRIRNSGAVHSGVMDDLEGATDNSHIGGGAGGYGGAGAGAGNNGYNGYAVAAYGDYSEVSPGRNGGDATSAASARSASPSQQLRAHPVFQYTDGARGNTVMYPSAAYGDSTDRASVVSFASMHSAASGGADTAASVGFQAPVFGMGGSATATAAAAGRTSPQPVHRTTASAFELSSQFRGAPSASPEFTVPAPTDATGHTGVLRPVAKKTPTSPATAAYGSADSLFPTAATTVAASSTPTKTAKPFGSGLVISAPAQLQPTSFPAPGSHSTPIMATASAHVAQPPGLPPVPTVSSSKKPAASGGAGPIVAVGVGPGGATSNATIGRLRAQVDVLKEALATAQQEMRELRAQLHSAQGQAKQAIADAASAHSKYEALQAQHAAHIEEPIGDYDNKLAAAIRELALSRESRESRDSATSNSAEGGTGRATGAVAASSSSGEELGATFAIESLSSTLNDEGPHHGSAAEGAGAAALFSKLVPSFFDEVPVKAEASAPILPAPTLPAPSAPAAFTFAFNEQHTPAANIGSSASASDRRRPSAAPSDGTSTHAAAAAAATRKRPPVPQPSWTAAQAVCSQDDAAEEDAEEEREAQALAAAQATAAAAAVTVTSRPRSRRGSQASAASAHSPGSASEGKNVPYANGDGTWHDAVEEVEFADVAEYTTQPAASAPALLSPTRYPPPAAPLAGSEPELSTIPSAAPALTDRHMAVWSRFFENAMKASLSGEEPEGGPGASGGAGAAVTAAPPAPSGSVAQLCEAVLTSNISIVEQLLYSGTPPSGLVLLAPPVPVPTGRVAANDTSVQIQMVTGKVTQTTPLHLAALAGNVDVLALLCDAVADVADSGDGAAGRGGGVDTRDASGLTPLMCAALALGAEFSSSWALHGTGSPTVNVPGVLQCVQFLVQSAADTAAVAALGASLQHAARAAALLLKAHKLGMAHADEPTVVCAHELLELLREYVD